jgi:hypothetical protein
MRLDLPCGRRTWAHPSNFARCALAFCRFDSAFQQLSMGTEEPSLAEKPVARSASKCGWTHSRPETQFTQHHNVSMEGTLMKPTVNTTSFDSSLTEAEPISDKQIQLRAYELYEQRGREHGHDVEDWLEAETEVSLQQAAPSPIESLAA